MLKKERNYFAISFNNESLINNIIVEEPEFFCQNMFYFSYDNDYQLSIQSYFRSIFKENSD
jgi:hypothetical protein